MTLSLELNLYLSSFMQATCCTPESFFMGESEILLKQKINKQKQD
jgi:hypothetical protein